MNDDKTTQIQDDAGFIAIHQSDASNNIETDIPTEKQPDTNSKWQNDIAIVADNVFKRFLDDPVRSILFLGLIGYIIVAAFGHLETSQSYWQYIVFLIGLGIVYALIEEKIKKNHIVILGMIAGLIVQLFLYLLPILLLFFGLNILNIAK